MKTNFIDTEAFSKYLLQNINKQMLEAAEPILQEALKKLEIRMREKLATNIISLIEQNYSVERCGNDIRIMVSQPQSQKV